MGSKKLNKIIHRILTNTKPKSRASLKTQMNSPKSSLKDGCHDKSFCVCDVIFISLLSFSTIEPNFVYRINNSQDWFSHNIQQDDINNPNLNFLKKMKNPILRTENATDCDPKGLFIDEPKSKTDDIFIYCPHRKYLYKAKDSEEDLSSLPNNLSNNKVNKIVYKCEKCSFTTNYAKDLPKHIMLHGKDSCYKCLLQARCKEGLHTHLFVQNENEEAVLLKCKQCSSKSYFNCPIRLLIHRNNVLHACHKCNFLTNHISSLHTHMLVHKTTKDVAMFKCNTCSYETKYKHHLVLHFLRHRNENEVLMRYCPQCSFKSKYWTSLRKHMLKHLSEVEGRRYSCHLCSYKAEMKYTLKKHLFARHKFSYEK